MLKKTITYSDLDGNPVTEDFYFNIRKDELIELELGKDGGFSEHLSQIVASGDGALIMRTFRDIILSSVGRRSSDGKSFIKNQQIRDEFYGSNAYETLYLELITSADASATFIKGIVPADLADGIDQATKPVDTVQLPGITPAPPQPEVPAWIRENREPTDSEVRSMTPDQLREAYLRKTQQ